MTFELLSNDIILDIFDYIDGIHLLRAFYGLNARFNALLYKQYHGYYFNFVNCSKEHFDLICQQHLPFITNQISYLSFEQSTKTPGHINLFLSFIPSIHSLTHLCVLKFSQLYSNPILLKIINELHCFINLHYLKFRSCAYLDEDIDLKLIFNKLWNLPKLIYLYFDIQLKNKFFDFLPTNSSTSIQYLTLDKRILTYEQFTQLIQYTPSMKSIQIWLNLDADEHIQAYQFVTLTHLRIVIYKVFDTLKILLFLENFPNLRYLHVHLWLNVIHGYHWEHLIENNLLKLKTFELTMLGEWFPNQNSEEEIDGLLNTFRTSFWIHKHKWFIQCLIYEETIHLGTLPMKYKQSGTSLPLSWKSTDPNDNSQRYFNTIRTFSYPKQLNQFIPSSLHLTNIEYLFIKFPINDEFWSVLSNLKQLKALDILSYNLSFYLQLQTLLDRASNLTDLTICQSKSLPLQTSLFNLTNTSVRKLNLIDYNYQFNEDECLALSHSSLGLQCEILSIQIKNHQSIVILIEHMIHLKALHVKYKDALSYDQSLVRKKTNETSDEDSMDIDEVMQWLKEHLPLTCFISKEFTSMNSFRIWIK